MKYFLGLMLCLASFYTFANSTPDGKQLYEDNCRECHQIDGNSESSDIPNIAQFSAILTYDILDQFKSGDRKAQKIETKKGETTDMNIISKALKSAEVEAIAHYLSTQTSKPSEQSYDKELAEKGKSIHMDLCENCHVDEGTNPIEDSPLLRGQWKPYLLKQFDALSNKERYMPRRMKKRFRKLDEEDIKALIEFYISPKTP